MKQINFTPAKIALIAVAYMALVFAIAKIYF